MADFQPVLDRAAAGGRISPAEALELYTRAPLHALGRAADSVRRRRYPHGIATYLIDRNKAVGQLTLHFGADDLGSVMLEENVVSSAGARHRSNRLELISLIRTAGRIPAQRDTRYRHLVVHRDPADDPTDAVVSHFSSTALPLVPAQ